MFSRKLADFGQKSGESWGIDTELYLPVFVKVITHFDGFAASFENGIGGIASRSFLIQLL
ncbi:hypothetical protein P7H16_01020 [Paenibacillus larvae]|uniref:hypothetical protein n=1 Tax=Paenibacillus larvae TaxID=1464 RepID=UPI0001693112|nr:hypothetical protein [Paenibacillus larvae]AQR79139.1 hypothetical protein BXP28_19845 [Paenibacillus larvae subsp. larvae]MDE5126486.1 hypothetical protein [Paenibacillus larvae subsp. larvae]MDE5160724.1 hypothetical protein [Paenibacillus larvae subsp. larvae]MDT2235260.1 hypothetical protein [Paenibacillus larvae]MDT2245871.1 hypothetical protein [Paenibacillus larvae]